MPRPLLFILAITVVVLLALRHMLPARSRQLVGPREFAFALLLPVVATFSFSYGVFALAVIAMILFTPATAEERARLLLFSLPLLPFLHYLVREPVQLIRINYPMILCLGLALSLARSGRTGASSPRELNRWDSLFLLLIVVQIFMDARQTTATNMLRVAVEVGVNFWLFYYAFSRCFARSRAPETLLLALIAAACVIATIAVFETVKVWLLYEYMPLRVGSLPEAISGYTKLRGGLLRGRATFPESTSLSLFLSTALCMLYALRRQVGARRAVLGMGAILLLGQVATFARVGYVAIGAGIVACLCFERRYGRLALLLIGAPAVWGLLRVLGTLMPALGASLGLSGDAATTIDYRSQLLDAGLRIIRDHPLAGLSMTGLTQRLEFLRQSEGIIDFVNQPLTIFMRAGVVGGFLYYAMTIGALMLLLWRRRGMDKQMRATACACFVAIVALLAGLTTTSYGRNESTFLLMLAASAGIMANRRKIGAAGSAVDAAPLVRAEQRVDLSDQPVRCAAAPQPERLA